MQEKKEPRHQGEEHRGSRGSCLLLGHSGHVRAAQLGDGGGLRDTALVDERLVALTPLGHVGDVDVVSLFDGGFVAATV